MSLVPNCDFLNSCFIFLDPGHTVALRSAALLIPALDPDQDQDQDPDPDLILFLPADPAHVHVPMVGLIPAPLILGEMDAVMDAQGLDHALVQGLMGTGALVHHGLLSPTEEQVGRVQKEQDILGLGLDPLVASGAAVQVGGSHLPESYHHLMN